MNTNDYHENLKYSIHDLYLFILGSYITESTTKEVSYKKEIVLEGKVVRPFILVFNVVGIHQKNYFVTYKPYLIIKIAET